MLKLKGEGQKGRGEKTEEPNTFNTLRYMRDQESNVYVEIPGSKEKCRILSIEFLATIRKAHLYPTSPPFLYMIFFLYGNSKLQRKEYPLLDFWYY
jgi:hypothetical protein